jgi:DNA-binding GntR family transcriptional regulator
MTESSGVSSAERAYLHTKAQILRGDLAGGQTLSEGQICEALQLSRTPVHEAFLRLAAEQLLVLSSRKGAVVAAMSPRESQDVLEMREAIECAAAARIIREGGPPAETVARLRTHLQNQGEAVQVDDADRFISADDDFHSEIISASGNAIAVHLSAQLRDRQQRMRNQLLRSGPLQSALDDHTELLARLEARDLNGFVSTLAVHLERHRGQL